MIIGIDGNEANVEQKVGISEFAYELLLQFAEVKNNDLRFKIYLKDTPRDELPKEGERWEYRVVHPRKFWTQIGLPFDLYSHLPHPDVFFSPTHYAPRFSPVPSVASIMDLSYIHYPEMFKKNDLYQLKHWTSYSVKNASKVIAISESTKNDIIKNYKQSLRADALKVARENVVVVYPGIKVKSQKLKVKSTMQNISLLKEKYGIEGQFILFVGTLQPRKNIVRLIDAFSRLKRITNLQLVIVGKKGWLYQDILAAPKKFEIEDRVKFLDFVPDEDLSAFYQNAICFILPSLYEGFGLPVLEAMKYGCPVLASNVSSLPEAGGDAALYFDPLNVDDIAQKIEQVLKDNTLRRKMKEKGFEQAKKFSWEKAAEKTLEVLRGVVKGK